MFIKPSPSREPDTNDSCSPEAQTELQLKEPSYQAFYDYLPAICFVLDPAGAIVFANQFSTERLGYCQQDLIAQLIFSLFLPEDQQQLQAGFSAWVEGNGIPDVASWEGHRLGCADGTYLWVKARTRILPEAFAQPLALNGRQPQGEKREKCVIYHEQLSSANSPFHRILWVCEEIPSPPAAAVQDSAQKQRYRRQNKVLVELARSNVIEYRNFKEFVKKFTTVAAENLETERVSVWLYSEDRTQLRCMDWYEASTQQHLTEIAISSATSSADFQLLNSEVATGDHPPSASMSAQWEVWKQGSGSLRIPIWLGDRIGGIVCFERSFEKNSWDEDEEYFAKNLVNFVAIAVESWERTRLEVQRREQQQHLLSQYYEKLEERVEKRTAEIQIATQKLQQEIALREQVEAAWRQQQQEQKNIFDAVPAMIWHKDINNRLLQVNKAAASLTGFSAEELAGKLVSEIAPEAADKYYQEDLDVINSGIAKLGILERLPTASGEKCWIRKDKIPCRDEGGNIVGLMIFAVDITELMQVENERLQSRDCREELVAEQTASLLQAILESTADAILAVSTAGEVLSYNQKFLEMWNLTPEIDKVSNWFERLAPLAEQVEDSESFLRKVRDLYRQQEAESCDLIKFKNGRTYERYTKPIRVAEKIIGRVWCFRDITAHKQVQATLSDNERRFQAIFDCAFQFIGLLKPDGTLLEANKTALDFAGLQLADIAGRPFWESYWWTISRSTQEQLQAAIAVAATGEFVRYEVDVLGAGGQVATIDFSIKPVKDENGQVILLIPEGRNITESKQAELALRLQAERERLLAQIQSRIRSSLDLEAILNTTVAEVREFLQTDRVVIFRFRPDWDGDIAVESVGPGWMAILNQSIQDSCFRNNYIQQYQEGRLRAIEDIYTANLDRCYIQLLESYQVRANLVVPIVQSEKSIANSPSDSAHRLWGLLIAHHCSTPRHWQGWEAELLQQLAGQVAIALEQSQLYEQLQAANQELQHLASLDGLTKIANRRRFDEVLSLEWQRLFVEPVRLSMILCDIDCFKAFNDTYGHQAGDACLQQVASAIRDACRDFFPDRLFLAARYGGEEFAVILPNTDINSAIAVAEEIRLRVRALKIAHENSSVAKRVTISLGVASTSAAGTSPGTLIATADRALYQAKSLGRDRVVSA